MELQPPEQLDRGRSQEKPSIFLGGSIEQGACDNWQSMLSPRLQEMGWVVLNPRRAEWDATWEQSIENPQFVEQVEWELAALTMAEEILIYFDPATKAPISLFELGLYIRNPKLTVVCPDGFYRKGNVDVNSRWYSARQLSSLDEALVYYKDRIESFL